LVARWKQERHPHTVTELLELARNKVYCHKVLNWNIK